MNVSYSDAAAYCQWLSAKYDDWNFRLPTEAEWENAAMGTYYGNTSVKYPSNTSPAYNASTCTMTTDFNFNGVIAAKLFRDYGTDYVVNYIKGDYAGSSETLGQCIQISSTGGVTNWANHGGNATKGYFLQTDLYATISAEGGYTTPVGSYSPNTLGLFDMAGNCWDLTSSTIVAVNGLEAGVSCYAVRGGSWYATSRSCTFYYRGEGRKDSPSSTVGFRLAADCEAESNVGSNGWHQEAGKWYYYENGNRIKNAWRKDSKGWCWLTASGAMATSYWIQDGGKWYYLDADGYMVSNQWRKDSKGWCWLTASGAMATDQWVKDSKGWCYVGADGYCWTERWAKDSMGWIWLDSEGSMTKSSWIQDGGKWYYLDVDGYMVSNQWRKDCKGWCWLTASGAMATDQWVKDSKGWCYVGADGYCWTERWAKDSIGWIWLDSEGSMTKSSWIKDGNCWYYLDSNGYMLCNTSLHYNGKIYYFNNSGVCTNP